jgi:hypothetical protein
MADAPERDYKAYQARSAWYVRYFGEEVTIYQSEMEDGQTLLAVMEFAPRRDEPRRKFWTYVTNGMSERRMPGEDQTQKKRHVRLELFACTHERSEWLVTLLDVLANYPFVHDTMLGVGFTLPVTKSYRGLWGGYLIARPVNEAADFTPLPFNTGVAPDIVAFAQVVGLTTEETYFATKEGGVALVERLTDLSPQASRLLLDVPPDVGLVEEGEGT